MKITRTSRFKKDYKRMVKRGNEIEKLDIVIIKIASEKKLELKYKDHPLIGNFKNRRECHIEPNWLLIYKLNNDEVVFERTGSHSDLFE
jgi:mRNA interferase YafQ